MNTMYKTAIIFFLIIFLAFIHIATGYIFQYPVDTLNVILGMCIILTLIRGSGAIVWVAFGSYFLIELFTITPFGIVLFSGTITVLLTFWLSETVFTNQSIYAALGITFFAVFIYRLLYMILLFVTDLTNAEVSISKIAVLQSVGWELSLTMVFVLILYALWQLWERKKTKRPGTYFA